MDVTTVRVQDGPRMSIPEIDRKWLRAYSVHVLRDADLCRARKLASRLCGGPVVDCLARIRMRCGRERPSGHLVSASP